MNKLELWYPVKPYKVTQGFGVNGEYYRKNGINVTGHNGLDLVASHGQKVYAAHDGKAYFSMDPREGCGVVIQSNDLYEYKGKMVAFKTIYWHLINTKVIQDGQSVKVGDLIGYADSTGFSTGDHLHFALKPLGSVNEPPYAWYNLEQDNGYLGAIDPTPYFNNYYAEDIKIYGKMISVYQQVVELLKQLLPKK